MNELDEITKRIIEHRDARDWKQFHNPKDIALSLVLEASEVLEHFQWKNESEVAKLVDTKKEELGDEIADVLYYLLLLSHETGINPHEAFDRKMLKNAKKYPVDKAKGNAKKYTEL